MDFNKSSQHAAPQHPHKQGQFIFTRPALRGEHPSELLTPTPGPRRNYDLCCSQYSPGRHAIEFSIPLKRPPRTCEEIICSCFCMMLCRSDRNMCTGTESFLNIHHLSVFCHEFKYAINPTPISTTPSIDTYGAELASTSPLP